MIYAVTATLAAEHAAEFHRKLTDGSIAAQRPDGAEIVASMERARIAPALRDGPSGLLRMRDVVRWTETCYCPSPLAHERETVLDRYFSQIEAELVDAHAGFDGDPLMERLAAA